MNSEKEQKVESRRRHVSCPHIYCSNDKMVSVPEKCTESSKYYSCAGLLLAKSMYMVVVGKIRGAKEDSFLIWVRSMGY